MKTAYEVKFGYAYMPERVVTRLFTTDRDFNIWIVGNESDYIIQSKQYVEVPEETHTSTWTLN